MVMPPCRIRLTSRQTFLMRLVLLINNSHLTILWIRRHLIILDFLVLPFPIHHLTVHSIPFLLTNLSVLASLFRLTCRIPIWDLGVLSVPVRFSILLDLRRRRRVRRSQLPRDSSRAVVSGVMFRRICRLPVFRLHLLSIRS